MEIYRNKFPFKIGTTSYILEVAEDNLMTNIRFLKDRFDVIQLLFMGREYLQEIMSPSIIRELASLRKESGVSFTVHLPADLDMLNPSEESLHRSIDVIERIIHETGPLSVDGYVLHVDRFVEGAANAGTDSGSRQVFRSAIDGITFRLGKNAEKIFIENTFYDLTFFKDMLLDGPCKICMDAGHLFFFNQDYDSFVDIFREKIRQIHLHGFREGKDHRAVSKLRDSSLKKIVKFQEEFHVPLILEVFNLDDLRGSVNHLKSFY
jgi:sugar phosphate isomerase/epimerase